MAASTVFFLDAGARGQRLCAHYPARGTEGAPPRAQVLLLPPFGEEMNKSRRMIALGARAFAAAGFEVLTMDLLGCGDSSGDFGDASWAAWQDDVRLGVAWLDQRAQAVDDGAVADPGGAHVANVARRGDRTGNRPPPLWLWGLRAGALLAPAAFADGLADDVALARPLNLLLWQPVTAGKVQLQQFMRLRVAADLIGGQAKGAMQAMRDQLARGEAVEIAGYALSPALAEGLEAAQLKPSPRIGRVAWMELSPREDASLTPAAEMAVSAWRAQGAQVRAAVSQGPSFWAATEIEEAPRLIEASLAALTAGDDFEIAPAAAVSSAPRTEGHAA